ncbi:MAG: formate dehydrogenase accessory sulfurtransferase FdhD [Nitrospira sp.]|nr:formate dehydrogenase accessory sulfurtransferase FdhD [Nitrospira sp.]
MNPYVKRKVVHNQGASFEERDDIIAIEKRLRVSLNGKEVMSLYCTPLMIKELIIGLFRTEGIITDTIPPDDIEIVPGEEIIVDIPVAHAVTEVPIRSVRCLGGFTITKKRNFEQIKDDFSLDARAIRTICREFQQRSELFRLTGCFHSAALSDGKSILVFAEDIGRHNAVDKVIGHSLLKGIPFTKKVMVVSCRLSSEIVSKCARWGIPIVASRTAPTDLAIQIAEASGVTLAGFVRGERMNIYTHPQRILL